MTMDEIRPVVSVAVCTYNRASFLIDALASLRDQVFDHGRIEIVVIDNGSEDSTVQVVENHQAISDIRTHLYFSPTKSLSAARNVALDKFSGDIICFLDDDAQATPTWISELVSFFESDKEGIIGAIGGRVEPLWEVEPSVFNSGMFRGMYSLCDYSPVACEMVPPHVPTGVNFAVRRRAVASVGRFNTKLGRKGELLLSGEETVFLESIRSSGFLLYYVPSMVVYHFVSKERLTENWVLQRATWGGKTHAIMQHLESQNGITKYSTVVTSAINLVRYALTVYWLPGSKQQKLERKANMHVRLGYLSQIFSRMPN